MHGDSKKEVLDKEFAIFFVFLSPSYFILNAIRSAMVSVFPGDVIFLCGLLEIQAKSIQKELSFANNVF